MILKNILKNDQIHEVSAKTVNSSGDEKLNKKKQYN